MLSQSYLTGDSSKVKNGLKVGKDFIACGIKRLVELFRKRVSVERMFGKAKEWLLLDYLRVRGLEQVFIHSSLCFSAMIIVALTAVMQSITPIKFVASNITNQ